MSNALMSYDDYEPLAASNASHVGAEHDHDVSDLSKPTASRLGAAAGAVPVGVVGEAKLEATIRLEAELETELNMDDANGKDPIFRGLVVLLVALFSFRLGYACLSPYMETLGCCDGEAPARYSRASPSARSHHGKLRSAGDSSWTPVADTDTPSPTLMTVRDEWSSTRAEWRQVGTTTCTGEDDNVKPAVHAQHASEGKWSSPRRLLADLEDQFRL
jgi:hypothetical protein